MDRKPADAKIVMCEPDQEFCLQSQEGGVYQVAGSMLFATRDALVRTLLQFGATIEGDRVWL